MAGGSSGVWSSLSHVFFFRRFVDDVKKCDCTASELGRKGVELDGVRVPPELKNKPEGHY
jgi:hypothetical protein